MRLVLGIDGGSTKTVAVAAGLDGRIRGVGRAGCSNWETAGLAQAVAAISACRDQALRMAGAPPGDMARVHLGLAGLDWPDDEHRLRAALIDAGFPADCTMENDAFLGVRACSPDGRGVGVGAGTGVCACIIPRTGTSFFYGGFVDLGGGIDINGYTLQAVIRAADGRGPRTALTAPLLEAAGCASVYELVHAICRENLRIPGHVLRPILFAAAAAGDPAGMRIVRSFGRELALCAANLIRRRWGREEDPPVVASGSLFTRTGPLLFEIFRREVQRRTARARVILADLPPVLGAVRKALEAEGAFSPEVWERVRSTVPGDEWFRTEKGDAERTRQER